MKIIYAEKGYIFKKDGIILNDILYLGIDDLEQNYQQVKKPIEESEKEIIEE